jgi:hypothetical protein
MSDLRPEPSAAAIEAAAESRWERAHAPNSRWEHGHEDVRNAYRFTAHLELVAAYAADEGLAALRERVECLEQEKSEALVLASQRLRFIEECDEAGDLLAAENERLNDIISPLNAKRNILQEELDAEARTHIHTKARRDAAEHRVAELEQENAALKLGAKIAADSDWPESAGRGVSEEPPTAEDWQKVVRGDRAVIEGLTAERDAALAREATLKEALLSTSCQFPTLRAATTGTPDPCWCDSLTVDGLGMLQHNGKCNAIRAALRGAAQGDTK